MYTPQAYAFKNDTEKVTFMKRYSFATIVTNVNDKPVATPLPFVVEEHAGRIVLSSHFALANGQAQHIKHQSSLVIFSGPHAYISPAHYDKKEAVPTWNYIAVHAYGTANIIGEDKGKIKLLEKMIGFYEPEYRKQWDELPDKFKYGMLKGIVAFEIEVKELLGQKKLSQNKTATERSRIAAQLQQSSSSVEKDIAGYTSDLDAGQGL